MRALVMVFGFGMFASHALADTPPDISRAPGADGPPGSGAKPPAQTPVTPPPSDDTKPSKAPGATDATDATDATATADAPDDPSVAKTEEQPDPLADLPPACEPIAKRMAKSPPKQVMSAKIALANCISDKRVAALELLDTQESMLEIEAAMTPSFALLDDVVARGDLTDRLLAHHAKLELLQQASQRMLASVPPAAQPTTEAAQLRDVRRSLVVGMIEPWRDQQREEAKVILAIAKANPALQKNAVVATALRESKKVAPKGT